MLASTLDARYMQALWRGVGTLVFLGAVLLVFVGHVNDWVRLGFNAAVLAVTWPFTHGPRVRIAAIGVLAASYLVLPWMMLDPNSMFHRMDLGVFGYGTLLALTTTGPALYFGWPGAVGGMVISTLMLLPFTGDRVWAFTLFLNATAGVVGGVTHGLLVQLQAAKSEIERIALLDELTGLENRRALALTLNRYLALASRRGVNLLVTSWDVNDLKRINDNQGHAAGDAHLKHFAEVLRQEARLEDAFFRMGGDEFVGLHLGLTTGTELLERVQAHFPPVAAGWAVVDVRGFEAALVEADRLLYANKAQMKQAATHRLAQPLEA